MQLKPVRKQLFAFIYLSCGAIGALFVSGYISRVQLEDPIFSTAWGMLDTIKIECLQMRVDSEKDPMPLLGEKLGNLEFFYTKVLSRLHKHPSFNPFSICYRDFLIENNLPITGEAVHLFDEIDEKKPVRALFYRDYFNVDKW